MLVSIIINNHNYGAYLAEAINSLLSQTYPAVELIVVDDGSTDNSREIIAAYGNRIVALFKDNGGQASAVNEGFAHSHGQVVIFLDADDVLLPMAAARTVAVFAARPGMVKVQYRMSVIDAQGRDSGVILPVPRIPFRNGDLRREEVSFPFDVPWASMSGNAFSADILRQIMPIPSERYRAGADWYLAHVTTLFGEVYSLEEVCAHYRVHGANQFGRTAAVLDLARIRKSVRRVDTTCEYIALFADRLCLPRPNPILSVSNVAGRLALLRLSPTEHPLRDDTVMGLVGLGLRATSRRFDIGWPLKAMFVAWFLGMGLAPRPIAYRLAELLFVPEKRRLVNAWLGRLHRRKAF